VNCLFRKYLSVAVALLSLFGVKFSIAQGNLEYNTVLIAPSYINPAYSVTTGKGDVHGSFRQQTMRFTPKEDQTVSDGQVTYVGGFMPLKKINSAIGANFQTQTHGLEEFQKIKLSYAYGFEVADGVLGIGLNGGVEMLKYGEGLVAKDVTDPFLTALRSSLGQDVNLFNVDAGLFYKRDKLFFGVSAINGYSSKLEVGSYSSTYNVQHLYVVGGYNYQTSNPSLNLKPAFSVVKVVNSLTRLNLNVLAEYNKIYFGGLTYSTGQNVAFIVGLEFRNGTELDGLRFAASYDVWANKLTAYNRGSLEFTVGYAFKMNVEKITKTYKSVRFL